MKKFWIIVILVFLLLPTYVAHAQSSNAGFVPGNIWYSLDPFEENDKIQIYTVLFNPDQREFSGTVIFFDKTTFLGKKDFAIGAREVKDMFIDWTVTAGDHTIFAKIENAKFLISAGKYEDVYLLGNQTEESKRTVAKKIISKTVAEDDINKNSISVIDNVNAISSKSIENIKKVIGENTPEFLVEPIISTAIATENFRSDMDQTLENKKETIQNQIKTLESNKTETNKFLKPFKYVESFFFALLSFIFNSKIIFYGSLVIIIFLILRYIWHLIF
ncbi:hypothetical protein A2818_01560 [Candidatus Nomurabacteria bacterium RIFCSPHIGHO2_01_FULL_40_12]|uniref:DUF5667 domain-containing protein n=1 Tax=Candidatus Nomurabacteria bacterium RIFCSPHIGHO2_01_FULL_40_12 TaxID=1801737 RepID=A0A1F6V0Y3_9BACT|nr:MAG: hypothetical protein A2818_01560 [Candidatus Nomurabacteria bacterium RIFCSPHIGHO2_01_FULL_40_12]